MATVWSCFFILSLFCCVCVDAFEPRLKCYSCRNCAVDYKDKAVLCSPRFYFCVFLAKADGTTVDRYCGDAGNCTALLEPGGNCSMCSAPLCNDVYNPFPSGQHPASGSVALSTLLITLLVLLVG